MHRFKSRRFASLSVVVPLITAASAAAAAAGWSIQSAPSPVGAKRTSLNDVKCTSPSACIAVGEYQTVNGSASNEFQYPSAEFWNGKKWSAQHLPRPGGANFTYLKSISCTSSSACMVVGSYAFTADSGFTLAERWNGKKWSLGTPAKPAGATSSGLSSVSCTSSSSCIAVGGYDTTSGSLTLAERWNGKTWSIQKTVNPANTSPGLVSVSCTSNTACTAVGDYIDNSTSNDLSLAERWNGSSWSLQSTPNPGLGVSDLLSAVSCSSSKSCTAVGEYVKAGAHGTVPLAEHWNGTSWTVQAMPNPKGGTDLFGIACASHACTAVGSHFTSQKGLFDATVAEHWNGKRWLIQPTPNPAGTAVTASLSGVFCTSSTACTAVGNVQKQSGGFVFPLIEHHP